MNGTVDLNLLPEEDPSIDPHMDFMIAYMDLGGLIEVPDSSTAKPTVSESGQEDIQIWNKLASSNEDFEYILIREQERIDTQVMISTVASDLKLRIDRLIEKLPILYEKVFEGDHSTRGEFLTKIDTAKRLSEYLERCLKIEPTPIKVKGESKKNQIDAEPTLDVIRAFSPEEIEKRYNALYHKKDLITKINALFNENGYLDSTGKWTGTNKLFRAAFFELMDKDVFKSDSYTYNSRILAAYYGLVLKKDGEQIKGYGEKMFQKGNPPGDSPATTKMEKILSSITQA